MVTVKDQTAQFTPTTTTLNDIPVGQLFRGRVYFVYPTYQGYRDGIFRKYRNAWLDAPGVGGDCLVVAQTSGGLTVTYGAIPGLKAEGMAFFLKCCKVENYEPLVGELVVTKPR